MKWVLKRWNVFLKTFLTLFFVCNSIWSAYHLYKEDHKSVIAFVFFVFFLFLQFIANMVYLGFHWKDCRSEPHKINKYLTLGKTLITLFLEMPMLVSQAYTIKSIIKNQKSLTWSDYSWDIAIQFQFVFNFVFFVIIDVPYQAHRFNNTKLWIEIALCLVASVLALTPVHLAQLGWIWRPHLSDFGGGITDTNTRNILSFSMYAGAAGLWTWPATFPLCCVLVAKLKFEVLNFGASLKFFLIHFNIVNGIWSTKHLYQLKLNDSSRQDMMAFVVFFILQAVSNLILINLNFYFCEFPCQKKKSRRRMITAKILIAFFFEIPMLTFQAHAINNIDDLVWSHLKWDISIHLQFMVNLILFVAMDIVSDNMKKDWIYLLPTIPTIIFMYTPVYLVFHGWEYSPKISNFGGVLDTNDNCIINLLHISMVIGMCGLYMWTFMLAAFLAVSVIVIVLAALYKLALRMMIINFF